MCRGGVLSVFGLVCLVLAAGACSSDGDDKPNPSKAGAGQGGAPQGGAASAGRGGSPAPLAGSPATGGSAPTAGSPSQAGASPGGGGGAPSGGASSAGTSSGGASGAPSGGASGSAGNGGAGGSPAVELKMPIESNGKYTLAFGDVSFTVDPAAGARVTEFSLKGKNLLTDSAADMSAPEKNNWGSTFWPSPQSAEAWGGMNWPPIPEIDSMAYTTTVEGTTVVMKSAVSARGKMSLIKRFTPVLNAQAIDFAFELKNENTTPMNWAPWQITRVALNGLTFFPTGTNVVPLTMNALPTARVMNMGGVSWYKNQSGDEGKYSADGMEGWLAQVSSDLLFIKRFADIPPAMQAPNEGDSEIFAGKGYVEVEVQGAYGPVAPGMSLKWSVRWYVRQLADPAMATIGNADLVTMVRDIIKQ